MSFTQYMKSMVWDFVLVLASVWALTQTVFDVFFVPAALQYGPIPLLVSAGLLLVLFAATYRRDLMVKLGITYIVLVVGIVLASVALTGGNDWFDNETGNWFFGAVAIVVCTTVGFLLTRTLPGSALWFIIAVFACALVQFFYLKYEFVLYLVVLLTSLALIIYKNCQTSLFKSTAVRKMSFPATFAVSAVSVLVSVGLAAGVWFIVIAPTNPQAMELHLITEYHKENVDQVKGTGNFYLTPNVDMKSQNLKNGDKFTTDDLVTSSNASKEVPAKAAAAQQSQEQQTQQQQQSGGAKDQFDQDSDKSEFDPSSYELPPIVIWTVIILGALIVLAIVGYFIGRRIWRKRRLARLMSLPPEQQVSELYLFLLGRLGRIGFSVPDGATLIEYATNTEANMVAIANEGHTTLPVLTRTYVAAAYGRVQPTEDDLAPLVSFYRGFWKGARKYLGNIKYFFKSFRL